MSTILKFSSREDLYEFVLNNRCNNYRIRLKTGNKDLFNLINSKYKNVKNFGESMWLYCNYYEDTKRCKCGEQLVFENVVNGYKCEQCRECYDRHRKENSVLTTTLKEQDGKSLPKCDNPACTKPVMLNRNGTWGTYCSFECRGQYNSKKSRIKAKSTMKKNHGVEHALQSAKIYNQMVDDLFEKHGVTNVMHIPCIQEKLEATCLKLYGFVNPMKNASVKLKHQNTCFERYGVKNPSQDPEIHRRKMETSFKRRDYIFDSMQLALQGYEPNILDHLRKLYELQDFSFMLPAIVYKDELMKEHYYHPDFTLLGVNSEVKSEYTFEADREINMRKFFSAAEVDDFFLFIKQDELTPIFSTVRTTEINDLCNILCDLDFDEYIFKDDIFYDFYSEANKLAIKIIDDRLHNEILQSVSFKEDYIANCNVELLLIDIDDIKENFEEIKNLITNKISQKIKC